MVAWIILALAVVMVPTMAQRVKTPNKDALDTMVTVRHELRVVETPVDSESVRSLLSNGKDVDLFRAENGSEWKVTFDARRGRPTLLDGGAIPFIPGPMNGLSWANLPEGCRENQSIPVEYVEKLAREFLSRYQGLLRVNPDQLVLDPLGSGPNGNSLYFLRFQWAVEGVPVERASVYFRINNGNLLQVATTNIGDISVDPKPTLSVETAWQILRGYLGPYWSNEDAVSDKGSLVILATTPDGQDPDTYSDTDFGRKIAYKLAYRLVFDRPEVQGHWEAIIDAHTGEVLRFVDAMRYGRIHGGIRPSDGLPAEEDHPFPFADTGLASPNNYSDAAGNFTGTSATTTLTGKYARIQDSCGSISAATTTGDIAFGSGPTGTDCSVPTGNTYGAGNTKPSRTLFWNCTNINLRAQVWNPSNTWLTSNYVILHVNGTASCNAGSSGLNIYFYKKATGCNNLGEIPGVAMHEWAHSYDTNDGSGGQSPPLETYADWTAIMSTHLSCTGAGFLTSGNCSGYGNACTACTGVRDCDSAKHSPATPWTSANHGSLWSCGAGSYNGPCGWEDHCESGISTQALWDFVTKDLIAAPTSMDIASAWALEDRLWFAGVQTIDSMYTCSSGTTSGCTGNVLYTVMRALDDTGDGTANGTPHAAAIYASLARHNIACGAAGDATNQNQTSCPTLTVTTLTGVGSNNRVDLSWPAVTNATRYWVFRNEGTCSAGFTKIATVTTTTYGDTGVVNGMAYNYRFQAATASDACTSASSNCVTVTPVPCSTPGTPTIGAATVPGLNQIQVTWTPGSPAGSTYRIYRSVGACPGGTFASIGTDTASPYVDSTVSGGTTYSYKVAAVDSTGGCESLQSGCVSATATGTCTMPPTFAGLTSATNGATAQCAITLAWSAGTSNCAGSVTYNIYRSTTSGFTPASGNRIATGQTGTSYSDSGTLVSGTPYYYVVRAVDSVTSVEETNLVERSATPFGPGGGSQTYVNQAFGTGDPPTGWTRSNGGTGTQQWTTTNPGSRAIPSGMTAPIEIIDSDFDGSGNSQDDSLITPAFDCTGASTVTLDFDTYYYHYTGSAAYIDVSTNNGSTWTTHTTWTATVGSSSTASHQTLSLTALAGTASQVKVRFRYTGTYGWYWMVDNVVITGFVNSSCTTGGGCTAPGAPTLNSATGDCNGVNLSWTAGSGTTNSYNVYRSSNTACPVGTLTKLNGTPLTATTYSDTTAVAGTTYTYVVRGACDAGGTTESANSGCLPGTRTTAPTAPTGVAATSNRCTDVQVTWSTVSGATSYNLLRGTACGTVLSTFTGVTSPYNDTTAVAGTTYNYWVIGVNACGNSSNSSCATGVRAAAPAAPAAPTFTNVACTTLTVNWTAVSGATSYSVYRKTGANCSGAAQIASGITGTSYDVTGLSANTQYGFNIVAANEACGSSANGACATVTTTSAPAAPTGVSAVNACGGISVSWTGSAGATSYNVLRGTVCGTAVSTFTGVTSPYTDTTAVAGTTYNYWVVAVNCGGTSANSSCSSATSSTPPSVGTLTMSTSGSQMVITWTELADPSQADYYEVMRALSPAGPFDTSVGTAAGTLHGIRIETASEPANAYYKVRAVKGGCAGPMD